MKTVEVWVTNTRVSISYRGMTVAEYSVDQDNHILQRHSLICPVVNDVHQPTHNDEQIKVEVITYEDSEDTFMALPRANRRTATTETIAPHRKRTKVQHARDFDTISDAESKKILNEIIASLKNNPHQTKIERAKETHRIASKLGVRPMAVAGVRANMTRGAYGRIDL